jgi:hypothetical protein
MKNRFFLILSAVALLTMCAFADVTITPKKTVYKRPKPIVDFKKTFTVTWPKVKASTPALARKIEAALSYEKAFAFTIREEMVEIQWLEEATYDVVYNKGNILCVALTINGTGAYPDGSTKYVVVDTRSGTKQTPAMVFANLKGLAAMVRKAQKSEIDQAIVEIRKDPDLRDPDPSTLFTDSKFTATELDGFSVDATGVTFHYDYGFPHVIEAIQPAGEFSFTWAQMRPYMIRGGLLYPMTVHMPLG